MNNSTQSKISIPKPCPFVPMKGSKVENGFHCKSCTKTVIDYRGKSIEDINKIVSKDICGIFDNDQLKQTPTFAFSRRLLFNALTVCSFLGFSISPVSAQVEKSETSEIKTESKADKDIPETKKEIRKTNRYKRRHKRYVRRRIRKGGENDSHVIGTPSF